MIHKNNDPRKAMKVPDGFFESIEDRIMENIQEPVLNVRTLWSVRRLSAIAACFVIILGGLFVIKQNLGSETAEMTELNLDYNWAYILEHSEDFSYEDIAEFEESDEVLDALAEELYGDVVTEDYIDNIDLEIIETLYE